VAERSLFLWNNEYIVSLVAQFRHDVLPMVFGPLQARPLGGPCGAAGAGPAAAGRRAAEEGGPGRGALWGLLVTPKSAPARTRLIALPGARHPTPMPQENAANHWNPAVHGLTLNVRKMFQVGGGGGWVG
jgi:hypothetical protein